MEKKSERLEVRLGYQEKQNFAQACDLQGDTPSGAIRRFITGYIKRSDADLFSTAWRGLTKRRLPKLILAIGIMGASCLIIWAVYQNFARASDSKIFDALDRNQDGQITGKELGGNDTGDSLFRVLDIDESGSISIEEFKRNGRMVYVLSGAKGDQEKQFKQREGEKMTLVDFQIEVKRFRYNTYKIDETHLEDIDRMVFWHQGGGVTVWNGPVEIQIGSQVEIEN